MDHYVDCVEAGGGVVGVGRGAACHHWLLQKTIPMDIFPKFIV